MTGEEAPMSVEGKVVLVTGAGSGIGAETARLLASRGATVVVTDRDERLASTTTASIADAGGTATTVAMDVTDASAVDAAVRTAVEAYGRLDAAVNNAAMPPDDRPLTELDLDQFERISAVNLRGVATCLKYELRQMYAQGHGSIVNVGSVRSFRPRAHNAAYVATKHGVIGLTTVAALESAGTGVRVNAVCPGAVETPMLAGFLASRGRTVEDFTEEMSLVGRLGRPRDIAEGVAWLCSDASSFVTGASLPIDGGYLSH
ncbi:SDR family NAD(P)-dependent oxidoreductase [Phytohabitans kaempferiae]|uniref:SDR family NAD(P)-dependent oxidoreductase n=1 Tax=Phytohabitans kaempferiae TaxID=1620943 RepID=A0ABV6M506_9ACTN